MIVRALVELGGTAHLGDITEKVEKIARREGEDLPENYKANIRGRLQDHCPDARWYRGGEKLFYSVYGLDARKGVWGLIKGQRSNVGRPTADQGTTDAYLEGDKLLQLHVTRERNPALIRRFKKGLENFRCRICGMDFSKKYGLWAEGYIEAHHVLPLNNYKKARNVSLSDLIAVCANCHRALHIKPSQRWEDLRTNVLRLRRQIKKEKSK